MQVKCDLFHIFSVIKLFYREQKSPLKFISLPPGSFVAQLAVPVLINSTLINPRSNVIYFVYSLQLLFSKEILEEKLEPP